MTPQKEINRMPRNMPSAETIRRHLLDNGITVLLYENPAVQTVVINGDLRVGATAETRANAGLASMTADLLMRGTAKRSFETIYDTLESAGASLGFSSGYQVTDFSASGLAEDYPLLLDLLSEAIRRPVFPADHVEKVRAEHLTGIQMRENDTAGMAHLHFDALLYGDHPYGRSTLGYADSLPALSREGVRGFHASHYGPQGMIVTVVGALSADTMLAGIEAAFGDWRNPAWIAPAPIPPAPRPATTLRTWHPMPQKTQSDIVLGLPGPLRSDPDYTDLKLANTILGVFGMMGRLGRAVREEQGLAYYAHSMLSGSLGPVPWVVRTGVSPDKVEQALGSIRAEIRRIQEEPVSAEELADSQAYLTGSLPMGIETNSGIASVLSDMELFGLGLDYLVTFADTINAVTPERVQAAAQRWFSADQIAISVAGPEAR
jgi:zinc protease